MTRRSFVKALDLVLKPRGFERNGDDWVRVRGTMWECVNRQVSWMGVTVNLLIKDLETEKLFLEIFAPEGAVLMPPLSWRVGGLIDGYDRWWKLDEPDGPAKLAAAVLEHGLPLFDRVRTLEQQAEDWYCRSSILSRPGYSARSLIGLALTLYRMGEVGEACEVLGKPVPRTAIQSWVRKVERVRAWLGCDAAALRSTQP